MDDDFRLLIDQTISPNAQALMIADEAIIIRNEALAIDRAILGREIAYRVFVDGVLGALERYVKPPPTGEIRYEFAVAGDVLKFVAAQLQDMSPIGSVGDKHPGLYRSSHTLFVDGIEADITSVLPTDAQEYVFLNPLPYALRIEQGESKQAERGVYELVAMEARQQFGDDFYIEYNLRSPINAEKYISVGHARNRAHVAAHNDSRVPSILIRPLNRTLH